MGEIIRILIADDHEIVRHGLALALNHERDFEVVGQVSNGRDAVVAVTSIEPDVIVLDWKMAEMDGLEAVAAIREGESRVKILLLTGAPIETAVLDALAARD